MIQGQTSLWPRDACDLGGGCRQLFIWLLQRAQETDLVFYKRYNLFPTFLGSGEGQPLNSPVHDVSVFCLLDDVGFLSPLPCPGVQGLGDLVLAGRGSPGPSLGSAA